MIKCKKVPFKANRENINRLFEKETELKILI